MKRREFLGVAGLAAVGMGGLGVAAMALGGPASELPPRGAAGASATSLEAALRARRSQRAYSDRPLPEALLLDLLWAAFGVNRDDGRRTAPSAYNRQEIDIYVVRADGAFRYDAQANARAGGLARVSDADLRGLAGTQSYAATAPVNLVYVADMERVAGGTEQQRLLTAGLDTGFISQNAYLFCAAAGLATVARTGLDAQALGRALGLAASSRVIMAQCVGYPKA